MNVYPPNSLQHLTPLVLFSGLAAPDVSDPQCQKRLWKYSVGSIATSHQLVKDGEKLATSPRLKGTSDEDVIMPELFWKFAEKSSDLVNWNPVAVEVSRHRAPYILNIQFLNNVEGESDEYLLPPVKTRQHGSISTPQTPSGKFNDAASVEGRSSLDQSRGQYPNGNQHSPLSPLTSTSDIYPDGLISVQWLQKYLYLTPSTFVSFHLLNTTSETREEEIEADEILARKINLLKAQLAVRHIKLVVVIVSEVLPSEDITLNDRIYYLRKNTGLAARTGLFFLPPSTEIELETLAETVCQLCFSNAIEFYTRIAKEVRRKRSGQPKTLDLSKEDAAQLTTSPLSNAGWEIRYSFKLGALAEFRQELESSVKAYEVTYEMALELFETLHPLTEISASRWNEFRIFLDTVIYKIIKLYFYSGLPNLAYKKFLVHLRSIGTVLETRGFSKDGFAYKNWRALQHLMLAELAVKGLPPGNTAIAPDADERVPADCLPRTGLLHLSAVHLWFDLLGNDWSEDAGNPDPFMNKDSTNLEEINILLKKSLVAATKDFALPTPNERSVGYTLYLLGESYLLHDKDYVSAQKYYKQAADIYRKEKWKPLLSNILQRLYETSLKIEDIQETVLSELELEIYHENDAILDSTGVDNLLAKLNLDEPKNIDLTASDRYSGFFTADYTFQSDECFLGLPAKAQLSVTCNYPLANQEKILTLNELTIEIEGQLASIHVIHDGSSTPNESGYAILENLQLEQDDADNHVRLYSTSANLNFKPGQTIVFEFAQIPKKLGEASLKGLNIVLKHKKYLLGLSVPVKPNISGAVTWYENGSNLTSHHIRVVNPFKIRLSPRPSLVYVSIDNKGPVAFGEKLTINVTAANNEKEDVIVELQAKGLSNTGDAVDLKWANHPDDTNPSDLLQGLKLAADKSDSIPLNVQVPEGSINSITLELFISYYSVNDSETLIKDDIVFSIPVVQPFVVNCDIYPRFHPKPWPNYFVPNAFSLKDEKETLGMTPQMRRRWELSASVLCMIEKESIELIGSEIKIVTSDEAVCNVVDTPEEKIQGK